MALVSGMHHVSLLVADTGRALGFYRDLLGLPVSSERPEMSFAGAWLQLGPQQIHLLELPNPDPTSGRPAHGGRDRHVALKVTDLDVLTARLDGAGIPYTLSRSGRRALFCRDPDGNAVELIEQVANPSPAP
jgi:glyoxylase I family protein